MESRYRTRTNPSLLLLNLKQLLMRKLSSFVVLFLTALKGMCAFAQATANFTYYFQILCLLGFIRTGVGAPIGDVVYSTALTGLMNLRPDLDSMATASFSVWACWSSLRCRASNDRFTVRCPCWRAFSWPQLASGILSHSREKEAVLTRKNQVIILNICQK